MREITQLNSQPFTKCHYHFPIILESVTCHVLLQWFELRYSFFCLSSEMMYMPHRLSTAYIDHDKIFKLVPRWGKCISIDFNMFPSTDYSLTFEHQRSVNGDITI
jgi:hypothetical protein